MNLNHLMSAMQQSADNCIEYYEKGAKHRKTFAQVYQDVVRAAGHLRRRGLQKGDRVGILGKNAYEWVVADLACFASGLITLPLDASHSFRVAETLAEYDLALILTNAAPYLDGTPGVLSFAELMHGTGAGEEALAPVAYADDDVFTLISTSGTSGKFKLIEVRKKSFDHLVGQTQALFGFNPRDRFLVFLPLHVYLERCYVYAAVLLGFSVILTPLEYVFNSIQKDRPTVIIGVPYFFENVYQGFRQKIAANRTYSLVLNLYLLLRRLGLGFLTGNRFPPFVKLWGGSIRYLLTGSAPIKKKVLTFYEQMGVPLYEGYGMSEIGGMIALNHPGSRRIGSVGKPFPGKEVTIDAEGQVLVKSAFHANTRYYKAPPEENQRTYVGNDTVATGDLGYFDRDGFLFLNGRKKDLIVLSTGVKVHPSAVEEKVESTGLFHNCLVYGNDRPYLVAVVVPKDPGMDRRAVRTALDRLNATLPAAEKIVNFHVAGEQFTAKNGMLTTSLKVNRPAVAAAFSRELNALY